MKAVGLEILQFQSYHSRLDSQPPQVHTDSQKLRFNPAFLIPSVTLSLKLKRKVMSSGNSLDFRKENKTNKKKEISFYTDLSVIVDCVPLIGAFGKKSYYPIYILLLLQEY